LRHIGEGAGLGAGIGIDGGADQDVDVLLAVFAAKADGLQEFVGGGRGEDGCHFFGVFWYKGWLVVGDWAGLRGKLLLGTVVRW